MKFKLEYEERMKKGKTFSTVTHVETFNADSEEKAQAEVKLRLHLRNVSVRYVPGCEFVFKRLTVKEPS